VAGIACSVAFLDLVIYFQHVTFHAVPALWRLHRVHHADLDVDCHEGTDSILIEILISLESSARRGKRSAPPRSRSFSSKSC